MRALNADERRITEKLLLPDHPRRALTHEQELFKWLQTSESPDEAEAIKSLRGSINANTFRVIRNNLYRKMLSGMHDTDGKAIFETYFHDKMKEAYMLQQKGLSEEAFHLFSRMAEEAEQRERYVACLQALGAQLWLANLTQGNRAAASVTNLRKRITFTAELILQSYELQGMYAETALIAVRTFMLRKKADLVKVKKMLRHPLMRQNFDNSPGFIRVYASLSRYNLLLLSGRFQEAFHCYRDFYRFMRKRFLAGKSQAAELINAGMDYCTACINAGKIAEGEKAIRDFSVFRKNFAPLDKSLEGIEVYYRSYCLCRQEKYDLSLAEHCDLLAFINTSSNAEPASQLLKGMQLTAALLHAKNNRKEEAIRLFESIASMKSTIALRAEAVDGAKMLRVIYGYEFSAERRRKKVIIRDFIFQTRTKQYYATMRKSTDNYALEKRILRFFLNQKQEMLKTEVLGMLNKLQQDVQRMKLKPENLYMKSMLKFLQFEKWIEDYKKKLEED